MRRLNGSQKQGIKHIFKTRIWGSIRSDLNWLHLCENCNKTKANKRIDSLNLKWFFAIHFYRSVSVHSFSQVSFIGFTFCTIFTLAILFNSQDKKPFHKLCDDILKVLLQWIQEKWRTTNRIECRGKWRENSKRKEEQRHPIRWLINVVFRLFFYFFIFLKRLTCF